MPSYRARAFVGLLRPGTSAPDLLPGAVEHARTMVTVEASDLEVVRGRARVTVRFQADDDAAARRAGWAILHHLDERADIEGRAVTRRFGSRWYPLR